MAKAELKEGNFYEYSTSTNTKVTAQLLQIVKDKGDLLLLTDGSYKWIVPVKSINTISSVAKLPEKQKKTKSVDELEQMILNLESRVSALEKK